VRLIVTLTLAAGLAATAAWCFSWPPRPKPKTVAIISHAQAAEQAFTGLRQGLAERGWREGDTIRFLYDGPAPSPEGLAAQVGWHLSNGADLMVALSTPAATAARAAAEKAGVPLLLAAASDPVASGLATSLTHPGQPVTGVTFALQEPRRLEWLTRLQPGLRTVWIPFSHADPAPSATMTRLHETAAKLDLRLATSDVRTLDQLERELTAIPTEMDAIFLPADAFLNSQAATILAAAHMRGVPVTTPHHEGVAAGALFSYGSDLAALGHQAARLANRILTGTPAADLPIEAAEMHLSINLATADRLDIRIPDDILRHAVLLTGQEH
jgi:putative ABC transport system substrate-binding protein